MKKMNTLKKLLANKKAKAETKKVISGIVGTIVAILVVSSFFWEDSNFWAMIISAGILAVIVFAMIPILKYFDELPEAFE